MWRSQIPHVRARAPSPVCVRNTLFIHLWTMILGLCSSCIPVRRCPLKTDTCIRPQQGNLGLFFQDISLDNFGSQGSSEINQWSCCRTNIWTEREQRGFFDHLNLTEAERKQLWRIICFYLKFWGFKCIIFFFSGHSLRSILCPERRTPTSEQTHKHRHTHTGTPAAPTRM